MRILRDCEKNMKSLKVKFCLIIALALVFVATLGVFFGVKLNASAEREYTVNGSSTTLFSASRTAEVWSHKDGDDFFTMFVLKDGEATVSYKKNLAYKWFYNSAAEDEEFDMQPGFFNMEIGFETLDFDRFILTFESQQYNETKDGKSVNYIVFVPANTSVKVLITDELPEADDTVDYNGTVAADHIKIEFTDRVSDEYKVKVSNEDGAAATGAFKNVGGNYAKNSSTSSKTVTPLTLKAELPEGATEDTKYAKMALYNLNGQEFKLKEAPSQATDGHYPSGSVLDTAAPVLCLDKGVSFIENGGEISFNFTAIDVLASSPSSTTAYFMLTYAQANDDSFNANDYSENGPYRTVKADDDQWMTPHKDHFLPEAKTDKNHDGNYDPKVFGEDFKVTAAVKIYVKLTDVISTDNPGKTTYVLLDSYVDKDFIVEVNGQNYIAVASDKIGATFAYEDKTKDWEQLTKDYQDKVTENAKGLKAGSKNKFYLPSVDSLISDNATNDCCDLTYSIFYMAGEDATSFSSETGKSASSLSFSLNKTGTYIFTVLATDRSNNRMYYTDKNNEKVEIEATSSNVLKMFKDEDKEGLKSYLPWFEFKVGAADLSIEEPEEQDTAYVGNQFNTSFEINGVSGGYETTYELYLFRNDLYFKQEGKLLDYAEFMERKEELIENYRNCFNFIKPSSAISETDEDYEQYCDYEWDNSGISFIPQDANAFYIIKCTATSTDNSGRVETAYMGISASPQVKALKGESDWLQKNLTSVILLSIAGASLVGIVLLLVLKPRNKGDLDEEFESDSKKMKTAKKSRRLF